MYIGGGLFISQYGNFVPEAVPGQTAQKSVVAARSLTNGVNLMAILPNGGNPILKIDATNIVLMKNLSNGNAFIKSITLNYSGNPWKLTLVINVDGGDYNKTINLS